MIAAHVDTDVLIRLITGDDPTKQRDAARLFHRVATGRQRLPAPATVIADAVFVLASPRTYGFDRVRAALAPLLELPGFEVSDRAVLRRALDLYAQHPRLDFGDAAIVAAMQIDGTSNLFSYDRDFDQLPGIVRSEPPGS